MATSASANFCWATATACWATATALSEFALASVAAILTACTADATWVMAAAEALGDVDTFAKA